MCRALDGHAEPVPKAIDDLARRVAEFTGILAPVIAKHELEHHRGKITFVIRKILLLMTFLAGFASAQDRVFELRTYTCYEGKLEALKANFRGHTIEILKRHGIESIGYWVPQDPEKSKNTLIFILAHPSIEAAKRNWDAFRNDPEWKKVVADSQANNGDIVSHVDSVFMDPTDFSKMK